jgi:putative acetyltransferase
MDITYTLRNIEPQDNADIAKIIRSCLKEFGADKPGTVYYEESTDNLFGLYSEERSVYFIAEIEGRILGGGGISPTNGLSEDTCELVKMYLLPEARGKGIGAALLNKCIETAKQKGFNNIYLESLPELRRAITVYEKFGFKKLSGPLGNTGHLSGVWMIKEL